MQTTALGSGSFSEQVLGEIKKRRLTVSDLAREVGVTRSYLSKFLHGHRTLDVTTAVRVALAVGIDADVAASNAVRARLPRKLLKQLPDAAVSADYAAARRLQRQHFGFEASQLLFTTTVDVDGGVTMVHRFLGLKPTEVASRYHFEIRERAHAPDGDSTIARPSTMTVLQPSGGYMEVTTYIDGPFQIHRLQPRASEPWPQKGVSCVLETRVDQAFDAEIGGHAEVKYTLQYRLEHLVIRVALPRGHQVSRWHAVAVSKPRVNSSNELNLLDRGVCASRRLYAEPTQAELVLARPLAGYTYAITWTEPKEES